MVLPLRAAPTNVCVLRLSAVGDICHTLPIIRTLQQVWPDTKITWVIGKLEHSMVCDIPDIEFIIFDKAKGFHAYRDLYKKMKNRHFDILFHMQMSLRASLASLFIPAEIRLGFDKHRANDLQWLFTNAKIDYKPRQHVIDSFFGFLQAVGIDERILDWNIPIPGSATKKLENILPDKPFIVISPCSSKAYRNWTPEGYASLVDYAHQKYSLSTVLTGGPSEIEKEYASRICNLSMSSPINLVGQTSLQELLAILKQAKVLIAPDSGPAHMATAVGTAVIGLYAATNPDRARPYLSPDLVVSHYPDAVYDKFGKPVERVPWGTRIRDSGTMERITVEEVRAKLDFLMNKDLA